MLGVAQIEVAQIEVAMGERLALCRAAERAGRDALSAPEWLRFERIAAARRRSQFLAAHWLLRCMLRDLRPHARECCVDRTAAGAPYLPAHPDLFVSLSHSGDAIACAVATAPVGIDVEEPRHSLDVATAAALTCTADEVARLEAAGPGTAAIAFAQLWSLKEAWLKAHTASAAAPAMARIATQLAQGDYNAVSAIDAQRGVVVSLVVGGGLPPTAAFPGPLAASSRWLVKESHVEPSVRQ